MKHTPGTTITRESFLRYEAVRESGVTNMLSTEAREFAALSRDEHMEILKNYDFYAEKYLPIAA